MFNWSLVILCPLSYIFVFLEIIKKQRRICINDNGVIVDSDISALLKYTMNTNLWINLFVIVKNSPCTSKVRPHFDESLLHFNVPSISERIRHAENFIGLAEEVTQIFGMIHNWCMKINSRLISKNKFELYFNRN